MNPLVVGSNPTGPTKYPCLAFSDNSLAAHHMGSLFDIPFSQTLDFDNDLSARQKPLNQTFFHSHNSFLIAFSRFVIL